MLQQPYLRRPPLDQAKIWLCCELNYCLHSDRRDLLKLPPFKKSGQLKFSGKPPSAVRVAGRFCLVKPLDPDDVLVCCEHLYCLHSVQRDRPYWIPPAEASHLNISGKILLGTVRAAGIFLLLPPLDQAYFWICDAPGYDTHYERGRLEI